VIRFVRLRPEEFAVFMLAKETGSSFSVRKCTRPPRRQAAATGQTAARCSAVGATRHPLACADRPEPAVVAHRLRRSGSQYCRVCVTLGRRRNSAGLSFICGRRRAPPEMQRQQGCRRGGVRRPAATRRIWCAPVLSHSALQRDTSGVASCACVLHGPPRKVPLKVGGAGGRAGPSPFRPPLRM